MPTAILSTVIVLSVDLNSRRLNAFNEWLEENNQALDLEDDYLEDDWNNPIATCPLAECQSTLISS